VLTLAAVAESSAQTSNSPKNTDDDHNICLNALNRERDAWDQEARFSKYAEEAGRRGLTLDACRQLIGQPNISAPTSNPSASAESGNGFSNRDIPRIVETSRDNEIRFNRDYKGKTFSGVLPFYSATEKVIGSGYLVQFGETSSGVYCFISDKRILDRVIDWNKGKLVRVSGTIRTTMFGSIALETCEMN
jgi:hypothetical protein